MKFKLLTTLFLCLCVSSVMAQEGLADSTVVVTRTGSSNYKLSDARTGYIFFQGMLGPNLSMNEDLRFSNFKHSLNWGTDVSFGKDLTPFWWLSLNVAYNKNSGMAHYSIVPHRYNTFNSMEVYATVGYSLTNGFLGFRPNRRSNLYYTLGLGAGYTFGLDARDYEYPPKDNNFALGCRMSLSYFHFFTRRLAGVLDLGIAALGDTFNGRTGGVPLDIHANAQLGVRVYLGKQGAPKWEEKIVYKTVERVVQKTDTVHVVEYAMNQNEYIPEAKIFPVFFTINSIEIRDSEDAKIKEMADYMKEHPEKVVFVLGYADRNTGNERINYYLGKNRSRVVAESLTRNYGIPESRIVTIIEEGDKVQPYKIDYENNRVALCIVTDFKE